MLKASLFFMLVGLVVGGPSFTKTRQQIESFRNFLEKTRTDHGVRLSERVFANPKASAWENSGKFEGDILLDDWQVDALVKSYAGARNAFVWFDANWPDNTIVYDFADSEFNEQQREAIMVAIRKLKKIHQEHNFALFDEEMVDNMGLPYEYNSCMHYGAYGFSANGEPTIEALQSFEGVMGQQEYVTENDWLRVRRHYKCPVKNSKTKEENGQKVNFVDKA
ncbi:Meprin A subunit beta [Papilio xuthus]|uniref:Meprin A subunit beta n=1 Tax=Papilio xuthus TaxID=66420 RepID=A0A194PPS5_PAPXU|nr:Meprin A subunit beta [Papilio xuthus]